MNLKIVGPRSQKSMDISWIEVETADGNFVLQRNHAPTILILLPHQPVTICFSNGKIETFNNLAGILEIQRTYALLLLYE